jgi:hypothetical protein
MADPNESHVSGESSESFSLTLNQQEAWRTIEGIISKRAANGDFDNGKEAASYRRLCVHIESFKSKPTNRCPFIIAVTEAYTLICKPEAGDNIEGVSKQELERLFGLLAFGADDDFSMYAVGLFATIMYSATDPNNLL